jgi:hypothetical protein
MAVPFVKTRSHLPLQLHGAHQSCSGRKRLTGMALYPRDSRNRGNRVAHSRRPRIFVTDADVALQCTNCACKPNGLKHGWQPADCSDVSTRPRARRSRPWHSGGLLQPVIRRRCNSRDRSGINRGRHRLLRQREWSPARRDRPRHLFTHSRPSFEVLSPQSRGVPQRRTVMLSTNCGKGATGKGIGFSDMLTSKVSVRLNHLYAGRASCFS